MISKKFSEMYQVRTLPLVLRSEVTVHQGDSLRYPLIQD